jgi:hypothetical protein
MTSGRDEHGSDRSELTDAQWAEIRRRMTEPREYASDSEVRAYFERFGLKDPNRI